MDPNQDTTFPVCPNTSVNKVFLPTQTFENLLRTRGISGTAGSHDQPQLEGDSGQGEPRRIFAASSDLQEQLVDMKRGNSQHGFVSMVLTGWAEHYPISIKPDDIWLLVLQGVSKHVSLHATELQSNFVDYEGSRHIRVFVDSIVNWPCLIEDFHQEIQKLLRPETYSAFSTPFSTTTTLDRQLANFALMDVCSNFMTYEMKTRCGFPSITIRGTLDDWQKVLTKSEALIKQCCLPEFADNWTSALIPVLERFVAAKIDQDWGGWEGELFWNSFLKRGATSGSGARTFYNGWIHVFFPYLSDDPKGKPVLNRFCQPYSQDADYAQYHGQSWLGMFGDQPPFDGTTLFPSGISKVPIKWDHLGKIFLLAAESGFYGVKQDPKSKTLECFNAWVVVDADEPIRLRMEAQGNTAVGDPFTPYTEPQ